MISVVHSVVPSALAPLVWEAAAGSTIADTMPQGCKGSLICKVDGGPGYVSREYFDHTLPDGSIVEWEEYPMGGEDGGIGGVIQFVVTFAAGYLTSNPYLIALAFAQAAINIYNAPVDVNPTETNREDSTTYSTGISGNQARLYQVIPKICGRMQTYPPFASQPYSEFDAVNDQYLYVLLVLGIGNHEIERVMIDDTDIAHFQDVLTLTYLPPGTQPSVVKTNVINSPEVGGQDLLTGEIVGGFAACNARVTVQAIGIDVIAPRGLGLQNSSGDLEPLEVRWDVYIRELNQFGTPVTPWVILARESRTANSREPQRWSTRYEIDPNIRPEIFLVRMDVKSQNVRALNDIVWSGMRAYLTGSAPLNANVAHFEVVMRSSKQLNGVSQNRISVIATALVPEVMPDGTRGAEIASRNAADWLADLHLSTAWGEGLDIEQVDMVTIARYKQIWADRQDRFDFVFDTSIDADAAAQIVAGSGRARSFRRGGVRSLSRDELTTLPRTAFHTRNTQPGSMVADEVLPQLDTPDGVIVEYWDNRSWNFGQPIECPCPGVTDMRNPVRLRLNGVTGRTHATREGRYAAAKISFRTRNVKTKCEMQGKLPAFGSGVRWQSENMRTQSGDVVSWDADALSMTVSEPPMYGSLALSIQFIRDDGTVTDAIGFTSGGGPNDIVLDTPPDFALSFDDGMRERTTYIMGTVGVDDFIVKIAAISDGGKDDGVQLFDVSGFIDDARIHAADSALLPGPGEIQDPIDTTGGGPGGGVLPVPNLNNQFFLGINNGGGTTPVQAKYLLAATGEGIGSDISDNIETIFPLAPNWLFLQPVGTEITSQFEVRFTFLSGFGPIAEGTFGVWMNMGVDNVVRVYADEPLINPSVELHFKVEIRDIATLTLQATATIQLQVNFAPPDGGGDGGD